MAGFRPSLLALAPLASLLLVASCTSCERECRPATNFDLELLAGEVDTDCNIVLWETELTSLDGLEELRSAFLIDIRRNDRLSDYSGLSVRSPGVTIFDNGGTDAIRLGPMQGSAHFSSNGLRELEVAVQEQLTLSVSEESLERLTLEGEGEVSLELFAAETPVVFAASEGVTLPELRITSAPWISSFSDIAAFGVPRTFLGLYDVDIDVASDEPDAFYAELTAAGFTGGFHVCRERCWGGGSAEERQQCARGCRSFP